MGTWDIVDVVNVVPVTRGWQKLEVMAGPALAAVFCHPSSVLQMCSAIPYTALRQVTSTGMDCTGAAPLTLLLIAGTGTRAPLRLLLFNGGFLVRVRVHHGA